MKARKVAEAEENLEKAEKAMKTSFFKRKPDNHTAALAYYDAGQCYYVAEDLDNAIACYEKSAELDEELDLPLTSAQKLEKCALLTLQKREKGCESVAADYYSRASYTYLMGSELSHAAECLTKAAKSVEKVSPEGSLHYWIKACNLMVNYDHDDFAADTFKNTLNNLIKIGRLRSAICFLQRMVTLFRKIQQDHNVYKCYLSIVVLALGCGDVALAKEQFNIHLQDAGYLRSEEIAPAEDIIHVYEEFDEDGLQALQETQKFNYVEQQVNRVAKMIRIGQMVPIYRKEADILIQEAKGEDVQIDSDEGLLEKPQQAMQMPKPKPVTPVAAKVIPVSIPAPTPEKPKEEESKPIEKPIPVEEPAVVPKVEEISAVPEIAEEFDLEKLGEEEKKEEKKQDIMADYMNQIEQNADEIDLC